MDFLLELCTGSDVFFYLLRRQSWLL